MGASAAATAVAMIEIRQPDIALPGRKTLCVIHPLLSRIVSSALVAAYASRMIDGQESEKCAGED